MTFSPRKLVVLGSALLLVLLFSDCVRFLGRHSVSYTYAWGSLSTRPAFIWTGGFTQAAMGTYEHGGYERPLPTLYLQVPGEAPIDIRAYTEERFVARGEQTSQPRFHGQARGRIGDAELGFVKGKLVWVLLNEPLAKDQAVRPTGFPCMSKKPNSERYCMPLSRSNAEELFGRPEARASYGVGWH